MASIVKQPKSITQPGSSRPRAPRHNPARAINDRDWRRKQVASATATSNSSIAGSPPPSTVSARTSAPRHRCCSDPNVIDGTCNNCGRVIEEDSHIVSEIQFGESSNGAAVVHGTFFGADQAGPRIQAGMRHRRVAGGGEGSGEKSIRDAKELIGGIAMRMGLPNTVAANAEMAYRTAARNGFVQGRNMPRVAAVCLYWGCRRNSESTVMLIDIADVFKMDVFTLGRTFKKMISNPWCPSNELYAIFPEDLIRRFADKLEFYSDTKDIQETAVRIVQRMDRDWILLGRKPAGICGSAIIIAARMHNYRRTPLEVAYVAKVTMHTLQLRLDEFRNVESANMRIVDFMQGPLLEKAHDPPAVYKKTKEYLEAHKIRKRKRPVTDDGEEDGEEEGNEDSHEKAGQKAQDEVSSSATATPTNQAEQPRTDAEGFVIPPLPQPSNGASPARDDGCITEDDISEAVPTDDQDQEDALAAKYGDVPAPELGHEANSNKESTSGQAAGAKTRRRFLGSSLRDPAPFADDAWTQEEEDLAREIAERLRNTESTEYAAAYATAELRAKQMMMAHEASAPTMRPTLYQGTFSLDAVDVEEDEFADDPEVQNCLLSEEERQIKEQLWLNENKDWLRLQQEKVYKRATAPAKKPRRQTKKARIGEGQATPASSASEAAVETMKRHAFSKRIDYSAIANAMNKFDRNGPGSTVGSRQTSRAGSVMGDDDSDENEASTQVEEPQATVEEEDGDEEEEEDMDDAPQDDFDINDDEGERYDGEEEGFEYDEPLDDY